ncbi:STAS domain-containing protein [Streptomyces sp. MS06]|uniref:STAS domain-containing protein n=1 Tax=Streptomyces sp. MS06 TaxID=3385974 RepID=UPI00399F21D4
MSCGAPPGLPVVDATTPPVLTLSGPAATGAEAVELCEQVRLLLERTGAGVVVCEVGGLGPPGPAAVDLLARLALAARRAGGRIRFRGADRALRVLLALVGLPLAELEGQPEQREPPLGVQEAVEPGDPPL